MELLTDLEKEIIKDAGLLWGKILEAIPENAVGQMDRQELLLHIHAIQVYIKSNAAARAYPQEFRPLGGYIN